jgi:hypothetical protein
MKNEPIVAIDAVLLVVVLGAQAYMTFQLNERLNQLSEKSSLWSDAQFKALNPFS